MSPRSAIAVLLIEDNPGDACLVEERLGDVSDAKYEVVVAATMERAIEELTPPSKINLVILDLSLPDSVGVDSIKRVRSVAPDVPVVILTGTDSDNATAFIQAGAHDFLCKKEINAAELRRSLGFALARCQQTPLLELNPDGVVLVDVDGIVRHANSAAARLFGASVESLCGKPLGLSIVEGTTTEVELSSGIVTELRTATTTWDGRLAHVASLRDITERRRLQKERDELEKRRSHAHRLQAIGQLAAGVAHEINSPIQYIGDSARFVGDSFGAIAAVLGQAVALCEGHAEKRATDSELGGLAQLLEEADVDFMLEEIPVALARVLEGVDRVSRIVQATKHFAHPGSEDMVLTDVNRALESAITFSRHEWKYVATVVTDLDSTLPLVPCFGAELNQVFLNLLVNAAHGIASAQETPGEGDLGRIHVASRREGASAVVVIRDSGVGISPEVIGRVFEPFFTTKEVGKGTGQGLALAWAVVVVQHGGAIDISSPPGCGATFTVTLPLEVAGSEAGDGLAA